MSAAREARDGCPQEKSLPLGVVEGFFHFLIVVKYTQYKFSIIAIFKCTGEWH